VTITEAVRWRPGGWRCLVCGGTSDNPGAHEPDLCAALWNLGDRWHASIEPWR